uniref:non-specific serine/threonine protein kinase n=1 Tax=Ciona savignyi TaxID=51511 RepID=H2ZNG7_CIOSA
MDTPKVDPLSKSLYTTASDRVLLKLTMGQFDSPNPKLLRTCSLPDLASCSDAQSDDAEDPPEAADAVRMSVASSMNDTNFDEDEEVSLPDSDAVATDDEEMNNLRANLENVLLEAEDAESSPSFSAHQTVDIVLPDDADDDECDVDDDASDDVSENGDWDSGSNASSAGEVSDTESVYSRLEHSREALERELGLKAFLEAYRYVQAIHEDEDEGVAECEARVRDVLGAKHDAIYPRILQLVMADGAYCEDNS